jgi:hypothetical protein
VVSPVPLPAYGDGQVVAGARRQRQQHGHSGQREADARLLIVDLRVGRLVLLGVGQGDVGAVGDEDVPAVPLPRLGQSVLQLPDGAFGQGAQHAGGQAFAGVAVAGGVGRARPEAGGGAVREDACDGVAAAVVVAEHLGEEAPDGRERVEQPVAVLDFVFVEDFQDAGLSQDLGEGQPLAAGEAGADHVQTRHGSPWAPPVGVMGTEIGALSAAASGHHSLFFAGQLLKETLS